MLIHLLKINLNKLKIKSMDLLKILFLTQIPLLINLNFLKSILSSPLKPPKSFKTPMPKFNSMEILISLSMSLFLNILQKPLKLSEAQLNPYLIPKLNQINNKLNNNLKLLCLNNKWLPDKWCNKCKENNN